MSAPNPEIRKEAEFSVDEALTNESSASSIVHLWQTLFFGNLINIMCKINIMKKKGKILACTHIQLAGYDNNYLLLGSWAFHCVLRSSKWITIVTKSKYQLIIFISEIIFICLCLSHVVTLEHTATGNANEVVKHGYKLSYWYELDWWILLVKNGVNCSWSLHDSLCQDRYFLFPPAAGNIFHIAFQWRIEWHIL